MQHRFMVFRKLSLIGFFGLGLIATVWRPLSPAALAQLFVLSTACMALDFWLLRPNPWIHAHHFVMFGICAAYYAYSFSPDYRPGAGIGEIAAWGLACTNTSWTRRIRWVYGCLNILLVAAFAYIFARNWTTSPYYWPFAILVLTNIVISMIVSVRILKRHFEKGSNRRRLRRAAGSG